jgi:hypothetical protein
MADLRIVPSAGQLTLDQTQVPEEVPVFKVLIRNPIDHARRRDKEPLARLIESDHASAEERKAAADLIRDRFVFDDHRLKEQEDAIRRGKQIVAYVVNREALGLAPTRKAAVVDATDTVFGGRRPKRANVYKMLRRYEQDFKQQGILHIP